MNIREDFEEWAIENTGYDLTRTQYPMTKHEDQQYIDLQANTAFFAWASCAEWYKKNKANSTNC